MKITDDIILPDGLWQAVFNSSHNYVWDPELRKVRGAKPDEIGNLLPTISRDELARWKAAFVKLQHGKLDAWDIDALGAWISDKQATGTLPDELRQSWRIYCFSRMRQRLHLYFKQFPGHVPILDGAVRPGDIGWWSEEGESLARETDEPNTVESQRATDIVEVVEIVELSPAPYAEIAERMSVGDFLGAGELMARQLEHVEEAGIEELFVRLVATWASPLQPPADIHTIKDLIERRQEFEQEHLACAVLNAYARLKWVNRKTPPQTADLAFRLAEIIQARFGIKSFRSPRALLVSAVVSLEEAWNRLRSAGQAFSSTAPMTAKAASIDVVRKAKAAYPLALPAERPFLQYLELLLGTAFRKFCECCERHDDAGVLRRAPELREHVAQSVPDGADPRVFSLLWHRLVEPVRQHVISLLEEGIRRSEVAASPKLALASGVIKIDLSQTSRRIQLTARLRNSGEGRAMRVSGHQRPPFEEVLVELVEPREPFDIAGGADQMLVFNASVTSPCNRKEIAIAWQGVTAAGTEREFDDILILEQQRTEPDWSTLLTNPPYTLNPVRKREGLFGRERILEDLLLHATSATSTFLWGQKRVGKTSLLQVMASELDRRPGFVCIRLRIGELIGLHEGQIAHTIAQRMAERVEVGIVVPDEREFGAGLSRLIPFTERIASRTSARFIVAIDEFDDLDPAFYTGERGRQFVKALRSLSEVGVTFFFVGSERMETIYRTHASDLNKWSDVSLSTIESLEDCKTLVEKPVHGGIEFDRGAVLAIVDYCGGNPFYMQLFCFEVFKRCYRERRTFVGENDIFVVKDYLGRGLGPTNFAHFWEDDPELDPVLRIQKVAENALILACVSALGGSSENVRELHDVQGSLGLSLGEQLEFSSLVTTVNRVLRRGGILLSDRAGGLKIGLPILRDWLQYHAELYLVPIWREFVQSRAKPRREEEREAVRVEELSFPISEDDLLAVSQRLSYCGKQKDVAEIRTWLRQFDDDARIEVAFQLLRRLAERGYVSEGERVQALGRVPEALYIQEDKPTIWRIVRGRRENLCIAYLDSETKSGASTARELAKLMQPAKCCAIAETPTWLHTHIDNNAILVIIDDFAGTGSTLEKGLTKFLANDQANQAFEAFCKRRKAQMYVLFSFAEALERLRAVAPRLQIIGIRMFDNDVRGVDPGASVFVDDAERRFALEVLLQIGRQLCPQAPLGFGDMGALVVFHNSVPNNTLPVFWSNGQVNGREWRPLFPRAAWR